MSTHRWIDRICVIVIVLSLIVTVLFMNGEKLGIELVSDTDAEGYAGNEYFTANDLNGSWDPSEATAITLTGDSAKISGNGAYWLDGSLVIARSGQYEISGELTDGNIVVDAAQYSKVWIRLNGVSITCSDDACIRVDQADKVFLTLGEGTDNTLTGGKAYSETALADGTNAVIFSHDDLTINGGGSLKIISACQNGITAKDDLIITGGTISVTAPYHGIRVNDHFRMTAASLTVTAEQDGIHSGSDIVIQDGTLTITAGDDAVHSDTSVLILGGTILVSDCYEGIEAVTIEISGGDITIHSRDDGLNANGYTGIDFGGGMNMQGQMPEMSGMPFGGAPGAEMGNPDEAAEEKTIVSADDTWIRISGGRVTILNESGKDADGIDSNGHITITGGTILVSLTGSSGNSALDSGSESGGITTISGGTIIACGDSSMAAGFDAESTQESVLYSLSETAAAGSTITLLDCEGNELISETIPYSFSSAVISCPGMAVGETCILRIGETEERIEMTGVSVSAGTAAGSGMMPGNGMPGGEGMGPGNMGDGVTPPVRPDGEEGFQPPEGGEGFGPPEEGAAHPEKIRDTPVTEGSVSDEASASPETQNPSEETVTNHPSGAGITWMLVLGSVLCLALGLVVALNYKRCQHIDT